MWGRAFAAPCRRKRCPTTARLRPRLLEPRASARQAQSGTLRAAEGPSGCDRCCFEPHTSRDSWLRGDNRELPPSRSPKPFASRSRRRPSVSWGRPERQRRGRLHLGGVLRVLRGSSGRHGTTCEQSGLVRGPPAAGVERRACVVVRGDEVAHRLARDHARIATALARERLGDFQVVDRATAMATTLDWLRAARLVPAHAIPASRFPLVT
jgi:hypothetical protein